MKPSMSYSGHVGTSNLLPAVGFMLIGALCSALLLFGLGARLHETPSATTSMVFVTSSSEMDPPIGGRLGGIDSSDTANDARTRAALNATMVVGGRLGGIISADAVVDFMTRQALGNQETFVVGVRLGGLNSSDTANDALVKSQISQFRGPGEGLNRVTQ